MDTLPAPHTGSASVVRVRLLGGLDVDCGSTHLQRLPSRAVAALLARLALWPERVHPREELVERLWPGVGIDVGRNRLRQALSTLKSLIEPPGQPAVLLADRLGVRVVPGALSCDARDFEAHVRAGRAAEARGLYRGDLLPGFYDDWIDDERVRLIALHDRLGRDAPADPGPHPPAREQRSEATAPLRISLPAYLTPLFGAEKQTARLRQLVLAHRLVTLVGPGGSGKTRLAVEVASSLGQASLAAGLAAAQGAAFEPFDLVAFVPLLGSTTHAQACGAVIGALHLAPGADDPARTLADALAGRRTLLVLDNFEQLVGQAQDLVSALLGSVPGLHALVTSRRALGLDGEHEFAVEALALPLPGASFEAAAANVAVSMFVERARAVRADFHLTAANAPTLVELVRALEGMPLAIELAATRVRSIAPAGMLERLRGKGSPQLELLARSGPRGAFDPRHASMQRVIEWSWDQLSPGQAGLLSALTVFATGFTAAAAQALAGGDDSSAAWQLDDLVAHSLVHARAGTDEALRFSLYQPIREFAAARLDAARASHWRGRLRAWALQWARSLAATPPLDELRTEMPNLLAALDSAVQDGAAADAVHLLLALRRCLEDVELPNLGLDRAVAAVEHTDDPVLQARGHTLLGPMLFTAGRSDEALRHAELGMACAALDANQRAGALHALARVRWRSRRRAQEVEPLLDEADALLTPGGAPELHASLLALRAFVTNAHHHDHAEGTRLHAQALALWQPLGNQHAINSGRYNLAVCAQSANQHRAALQLLEPVIASARELHDWRRLSQSLNVRGNAHSGLREWRSAVADYRECVRTAWDCMTSFDLAYGLWNLPRALAHLHQPEDALRLAASADLFWRTRFGSLSTEDQRYLQRIRRLAARQIDQRRVEALWNEGAALPVAEAVALALKS